MTFQCPSDAVSAVPNGAAIKVTNDGRTFWSFGALSKAMIK